MTNGTNHKPATALPWTFAEPRGVVVSTATAMPRDIAMMTVRETAELNAGYLVHAANAYPKLIAALQTLKDAACITLRSEKPVKEGSSLLEHVLVVRAILRELGESN